MGTIICKNCGEPIVEYKEGKWTHESKDGQREQYCQMTDAEPLEES